MPDPLGPIPPPAKRAICFSGPHVGVGKTTLAFNVGIILASANKGRKVIVVSFDAWSHISLAKSVGVNPIAISDIVATPNRPSLALPPLQWMEPGIAIMAVSLGTQSVDKDELRNFLGDLLELHDIVFDIPMDDQFRSVAFSVADRVVWVIPPADDEAATQTSLFLDLLDAENRATADFTICVNKASTDRSLSPATEAAIARFEYPDFVPMDEANERLMPVKERLGLPWWGAICQLFIRATA